jgi:hypothetical protein
VSWGIAVHFRCQRRVMKKIFLVLLTIHFGRGNRFDEAVGIIFEDLFVF